MAYNPPRDITFEEFAKLAQQQNLTKNEKIGFQDSIRSGTESAIFRDITSKIPAFSRRGTSILDIGCGCGDLTDLIVKNAESFGQKLILNDSREMLCNIDLDSKIGSKIEGKFPLEFMKILPGDVFFDGILIYSVLQYVNQEGQLIRFIDAAVNLLAPGGRLLLGDLPNSSQRRRFMMSTSGKEYHKKNFNTDAEVEVPIFNQSFGELDDGILLGIIGRYRNYGFNAYLVPQNLDLPMANRREDILIEKNK